MKFLLIIAFNLITSSSFAFYLLLLAISFLFKASVSYSTTASISSRTDSVSTSANLCSRCCLSKGVRMMPRMTTIWFPICLVLPVIGVSLCGGDKLDESPPRVGMEDSRPLVGSCLLGVWINLLLSFMGVKGVTCLFLLGVRPYRCNNGVSRLISIRLLLGRVDRAEPLLADC